MSAATKLDATFAALADPKRRKVIELLRKKPRRAGVLAEIVELIPAAMSRELRLLRECGLVDDAADAEDKRARVYRLRPERFTQLRTWLDNVDVRL